MLNKPDMMNNFRNEIVNFVNSSCDSLMYKMECEVQNIELQIIYHNNSYMNGSKMFNEIFINLSNQIQESLTNHHKDLIYSMNKLFDEIEQQKLKV